MTLGKEGLSRREKVELCDADLEGGIFEPKSRQLEIIESFELWEGCAKCALFFFL